MKEMNIPVGVSDFEEIRKNGYYYIDKSGLISELLSRTGTKVTLITRPRRFGKTLGMSMLENFFDIRKNSRKLFEGLEIAEHAGIRNLFCGDAWAENIPGGKYDLVKLPHHGSIRNISDALLSRIQADTFLICADGTSHPNKQTIAKLLQQYGNISIYSNYSWWMNGFLMTDDMKYIKNGNLKLLII